MSAEALATRPISSDYIKSTCELMDSIESSPDAVQRITNTVDNIISISENMRTRRLEGDQLNDAKTSNTAAARGNPGDADPGILSALKRLSGICDRGNGAEWQPPGGPPPPIARPEPAAAGANPDVARDALIYRQPAPKSDLAQAPTAQQTAELANAGYKANPQPSALGEARNQPLTRDLDAINARLAQRKLQVANGNTVKPEPLQPARPEAQLQPAALQPQAPNNPNPEMPTLPRGQLDPIPITQDQPNPKQQPASALNPGQAAAFGAAAGAGMGFVCAVAGVSFSDSGVRTKDEKIEDVLSATVVGAAGGGLGGALDAMWVAPVIARSGFTSGAAGAMAGAGATVGAATLAISVLWDTKKRIHGQITAVEQRKNFAATSAGTLGGTAAAVGAGAGLMALSTPVGWVIAAGIGAGVLGGFLGSQAGSGIDWLIWDEGEDEISHAYEFFNFPYNRGTKPQQHTGAKVAEQFLKKLNSKKNDKGEFPKNWVLLCNHELMILLRHMHPTLRLLLDQAERLKKENSADPDTLNAAVFQCCGQIA